MKKQIEYNEIKIIESDDAYSEIRKQKLKNARLEYRISLATFIMMAIMSIILILYVINKK